MSNLGQALLIPAKGVSTGGANPMLFASFNGTLAGQDRAGAVTITGSGATRYLAAKDARTNLARNPGLLTDATDWATAGSATSARTADTDFESDVCYQSAATAATTDGFTVLIPCPQVTVSAAAITVGISAKVTAGATDWQARVQAVDAAGTLLGSAGAFVDLVPGATVARSVLAITAPTTADAHGLQLQVLRKSAATSTIRVGDLTVETGTTAGTWFDPVWINPITGILGTAHASPSVSVAAAWAEISTTNTVPDPSFEAAVITTSWTAQGAATIAKVTTHAYLGSNGGKVVCGAAITDGIHQLATSGGAATTGTPTTVSGRVRAFAAADVGKVVKAAIIERTSADAVVSTHLSTDITLTDAWQAFSFAFTLNGGGTVAKVTMGVMNGAAVAVSFVLDAVQLELKPYATSYCDGAIGTGYTWAGTAHASASTRAVTFATVDETDRIDSTSGALICWMLIGYDPTSSSQYILSVGQADASHDRFDFYIPNTLNVNAGFAMAGVLTNLTLAGGTPAAGGWHLYYVEWDGTAIAASLDNAALETGTRGAGGASGLANAGDINIGQANTSASRFNGLIGPLATLDAPLTAAELTALSDAGANWTWGMF